MALTAMLVAEPAVAKQYESESRVVKGAEAEPARDFDAEQALQELQGNAYAQALLLRDLAAKAMASGDAALAADYLKRALDSAGLSGIAEEQMKRELGVVLAEREDHAGVIRNLAPLVERDPKADPELLMVVAGAYAKLERFRKAAPLVERALKARPNATADWYLLAGVVNANIREYVLAERYLERALRLEAGNADAWQQLVAVRLGRNDRDGALAAMEMAHRLGLLDRAEQRVRFVQLLLAAGVPYESALLLQESIEAGLVPDDAAMEEMLAAAWVAARETTLAIPALEQAARATGKVELYLQLGQLSFELGDWPRAIEALNVALARGAGRHAPQARMLLGVAHFQQGDAAQARRAFSAAAEERSTREVARQWMAYLDSGLAREDALRMAQRDVEAADVGGGRYGGQVQIAARDRPAVARSAGPKYTPVGAERAGSADGRIPDWSGGLERSQWPSGVASGNRLADPYPNDAAEFVVDGRNWERYRNQLSRGHQALLRQHADYRMPVYPTRRTAAYPQAIYEATQKNQGRARLQGSDALVGARLGFPFPQPETGVEAMWNHRVRYRGDALMARSHQAVVSPSGAIDAQLQQVERVLYRYANLADPVDIGRDNILLYYLTYFTRDSNSTEFVALAHETANSLEKARAIWVMPVRMKKMFRIPPVGYDNPFPGSEGLSFIDMIDMYNGAFDRYDWQLKGKREIYIPYNAYRLNDARRPNAKLLTPRFMATADARYELHRVWIIEATERGGQSHSFGLRRFYLDEDSWNVVLVENYDHSGELWRFQEGHLITFYDRQWTNAMPVVTYDLKDGRYFINRLTNDADWPRVDSEDIQEREFRPAAVRTRYGR